MKYIMGIINSKAYLYGNRYWAFQCTRVLDGKFVCAVIAGAASNLESAVKLIDTKGFCTYREIPIRQFNNWTRGLPNAGCAAEDIAKWIKNQMRIKYAGK